MSVPPGDRGTSSMQFLETADMIEKRAMEVCRKWPKSYTFVITMRTLTLASQVYEHVQKANAIFPVTTEKEREERILELERALGANFAFAKKIERAYSMFPLCGEKKDEAQSVMEDKSNKLFEEFMNLCADEEEAIKGNISYVRSLDLKTGKPKKTEEPQKAK